MFRRVTLVAAVTVALLAAGPAGAEQQVADPATGCRVWDQYPDARKTVRWSGACRDGFADGPGVLEWAYGGRPDGRVSGNFLNGRLDGRAQVEWRDGRRMDGSFRNGRAEGHGTFVWPDGRRYSGDWQDDRRTGFGTLEYPDGRRYSGEFYRNRPTGSGSSESATVTRRAVRTPDHPADGASDPAEPPTGGWSRSPDTFEDWLRTR